MSAPMTPDAALTRLRQYGERTSTWSTSTYNDGTEKALHQIAVSLAAEVDRLRARVAELEAVTPAQIQTCRTCGAGYTYGEPCSVCAYKQMVAEALAEDPHDSPLHHSYALGRDLPEVPEPPSVTADRWNAQYPVGTPVYAYPGLRPEDDPTDPQLTTRTRSKASVLGGHNAVVWVEGHGACISLTHVDPRPEGGAL